MFYIRKEILGKPGLQAKFGRLAVISNQRNLGIGKKLLEAVENFVADDYKGDVVDNLIGSCQLDKKEFYEKVGFEVTYPEEAPFIEGIKEHVLMHKKLSRID